MGASDSVKSGAQAVGSGVAAVTSAVFTNMAVVVFFGGIGIFLWRYLAGPSELINIV